MRGGPELEAILATGQFHVLEKITLTITRGTRLGEAATQDARTWVTRPASYDASLPIITRLEYQSIPRLLGQEVPATTFELSNESFLLADGFGGTFTTTLQELANLGLLEGAAVRFRREYSASGSFLGTSAVELPDFDGFVERSTPRPGGVTLECKAMPGRIAGVSMPRALVTPYCPWELFDARCGASLGGRGVGADVLAGSTRAAIRFASEGLIPDRLRAGRIECNTGRNYGCVRTVEAVVDVGGGVWEARVAPPGFPWAPSVGDDYWIWWGCDRQYSTCRDVFANGRRFGGFPDVPLPENMA